MVKLKDLIYMAGFLDADGSITISTYHRKDRTIAKKYYYLRLKVTNNDMAILDLYRNSFQCGSIYPDKRSNTSEWSLTAIQKGKTILQQLLPYLRVKRKQAEIAIQFAETMDDITKDQLKALISQLNHRLPSMPNTR